MSSDQVIIAQERKKKKYKAKYKTGGPLRATKIKLK